MHSKALLCNILYGSLAATSVVAARLGEPGLLRRQSDPVDPSTAKDCTYFLKAQDATYDCNYFESQAGITHEQFVKYVSPHPLLIHGL